MRLSIEITPDQHQRLKAAAALKGESIKDYVLKRTLPNPDEQSALQELEQFLAPRIKAVENGALSTRTVDNIFDEVLKEAAE
ncbi:MAG: DUF1778 domain-containing protein [Gammaproteobacteria bacterium]|nr:DUF1778 domain-containing protein [Gammaproteobacteria bacterium]